MAVPAWLSSLTDFWSKWGIRIAASSSLALHIILLLVADIRRYNDFGPWWTLLVWAVYQGLDKVGGYALGHLSLCSSSSSSSEQLVVAFWAPFLLLHLGGPDNISAYSLDDDKLSLRKAFGGIFTVLSALFVVLTNIWLADDPGLLRPASIIMVAVGILRFAENVWAMVQALVRKSKTSSEEDDDDEKTAPPTSTSIVLSDSSSQEISPTAKSSKKRDWWFRNKKWKEWFEEAEKDANKIYDVLYTKGGQVHTWRGYLLRLLSPLATAAAFALFGLYPKQGRVQLVDVAFTYVLLSTALLLDVVWLLVALASPSAKKFVEERPGFWFRHEILCGGWWDQLHRITQLLHPWCLVGIDLESRRYSSSSTAIIGQYDLVQECATRAASPPGCISSMVHRLWTSILGQDSAAVVQWSDYRSWKCLSPLEEGVKESLLKSVHKRLRDTVCGTTTADAYAMADIRERWGQVAVQMKKQQGGHWANHLEKFFGREFQEDILLWHIGTTIYLDQKQSIIVEDDDTVKAIKAVSKYLMFLVAARPHMLPDPPLRSLYEVTEKALQDLYSNVEKENTNKNKRKEANDDDLLATRKKLAHALRDKRGESDSTRLLSYAAELAIQLKQVELLASRLKDVVELVFDVWVDKLLYASIRCSRESHARQLGRGGEFITIAWIAAEYAGVFKIGETGYETTPPSPQPPPPPPPPPIKKPSPSPSPCPSPCPEEEPGCCYPKEEEKCHCNGCPLAPVCPHACCMQDYYCCCTQDGYYYC